MSETGSLYADVRGMYTVHTMIRREFALLPGLVRGVAPHDKERTKIVTDHVRLLVLLVHEHHSGEDAVLWPNLLIRAPKEIDPVVHLVEGHHEGIEAISLEIDTLLAPWTDSVASDASEALADALERLAAALYEHMALEEKLILPLVERHIFASEWDRMVEDGALRIPPEFRALVVGLLMYEGGPDVVPPQLHDTLADVAQQAYAAHSELVHGTPTPPRSADVVIGRPGSIGVAVSTG